MQNKQFIQSDLVQLADELDRFSFHKEASVIDNILVKYAFYGNDQRLLQKAKTLFDALTSFELNERLGKMYTLPAIFRDWRELYPSQTITGKMTKQEAIYALTEWLKAFQNKVQNDLLVINRNPQISKEDKQRGENFVTGINDIISVFIRYSLGANIPTQEISGISSQLESVLKKFSTAVYRLDIETPATNEALNLVGDKIRELQQSIRSIGKSGLNILKDYDDVYQTFQQVYSELESYFSNSEGFKDLINRHTDYEAEAEKARKQLAYEDKEYQALLHQKGDIKSRKRDAQHTGQKGLDDRIEFNDRIKIAPNIDPAIMELTIPILDPIVPQSFEDESILAKYTVEQLEELNNKVWEAYAKELQDKKELLASEQFRKVFAADDEEEFSIDLPDELPEPKPKKTLDEDFNEWEAEISEGISRGHSFREYKRYYVNIMHKIYATWKRYVNLYIQERKLNDAIKDRENELGFVEVKIIKDNYTNWLYSTLFAGLERLKASIRARANLFTKAETQIENKEYIDTLFDKAIDA